MNEIKSDRFRRTVAFDDDVLSGILRYRGQQLIEGKEEKRFGPAINELLREILTKKNFIDREEKLSEEERQLYVRRE